MASSKTEIVNLGLSNLGEPALADFDETGEAGRLARATYDIYRDAVLEEFPWNFASTRIAIGQALEVPVYRWGAAYVLPTDYLFVQDIQGARDNEWDIESVIVGGEETPCIVTHLTGSINVLYTKRMVAVERYPTLFVVCLAARLAMEWSEPLGKSQSLLESMSRLYTTKLRLARTRNSQESTPKQIEASEWIDSRHRGQTVLATLGDRDPDPYP